MKRHIHLALFMLLTLASFTRAIRPPNSRSSIYEKAFRHLPTPTVILDEHFRVQTMSSHYEQVIGEDWRKKHVNDLIFERLTTEDANRVWDAVKASVNTEEAIYLEVRDKRTLHFWHVYIKAEDAAKHGGDAAEQHDGKSEASGWKRLWRKIRPRKKVIVMQSTDLTGLVSENVRMRRHEVSADIYSIIVNNIEDYAVFMLSPDGRVLTWNIGAERLKQYTANEILGKPFSIFFDALDVANGVPAKELSDALHFPEKRALEGWRVKKDGTRFCATVYVTPLFRDGRHIGFVKVTRDMTDFIASRDAIIDAQNHAAKLKQEFLSTVSHEIRTLLNNMLSGTDLLSHLAPTLEQHDVIETIKQSGNTLHRIVNNLLDNSKLEAGAMMIEEENMNVRQIVQRVVATFRSRSKVPLHTQFAVDLPEYIVCDTTRFIQILTNLLDNAVKFTTKGFIKVTVHIRRKSSTLDAETLSMRPRCQLYVRVRDTGIGIAEENMIDLFQPFSQIRQAEQSTSSKGTGLGLSIAKQCAELMRGRLWVESKIGSGTTFFFIIEVGYGTAASAVASSSVQPPNSNNVTPFTHLSDVLVVVVDDNRINRLFLDKLLNKFQIETITFENGADVVTYFTRMSETYGGLTRKHIVLLDLEMPPGIDGMEATRQILELPGMHGVCIIGLTANAVVSTKEQCLALGMVDYLTKPVATNHILSCMQDIAARKTLM